jgi:hypothetical protein
LDAVSEENRPELLELWAQLMANAMDPSKAGIVSKDFIDTLRQFRPFDAVVLKSACKVKAGIAVNRDALSGELNVSTDKISVSFRKLHALGCIFSGASAEPQQTPSVTVAPYGRELMLAVTA